MTRITEYRIQFLDDYEDLIYQTRLHSKVFLNLFQDGDDKYVYFFKHMRNGKKIITSNHILIAKIYLRLWVQKFLDRKYYSRDDLRRVGYARISFYCYTI